MTLVIEKKTMLTCCEVNRMAAGWPIVSALGPMAAGWVSCKQIAHAGGSAAAVVAVAGGVVAPCVVQNGGVSLVKSTSVSVCETL